MKKNLQAEKPNEKKLATNLLDEPKKHESQAKLWELKA